VNTVRWDKVIEMAKALAGVLGCDVADHAESRRVVGMPVREVATP
jgi:hypothetical protein